MRSKAKLGCGVTVIMKGGRRKDAYFFPGASGWGFEPKPMGPSILMLFRYDGCHRMLIAEFPQKEVRGVHYGRFATRTRRFIAWFLRPSWFRHPRVDGKLSGSAAA